MQGNLSKHKSYYSLFMHVTSHWSLGAGLLTWKLARDPGKVIQKRKTKILSIVFFEVNGYAYYPSGQFDNYHGGSSELLPIRCYQEACRAGYEGTSV